MIQIAISIIIYGTVIFAVFHRAIKHELLDMTCPEGPDTKDKSVCKDGNGKLWANYRYSKSDSPKSSLEKLSNLSDSYSKVIIWRRYITLAFISSLLLFLITQQRIPSGFELLGAMVVIFTVFYVAHNYYSYHHDRFISEATESNLKHLKTYINKRK